MAKTIDGAGHGGARSGAGRKRKPSTPLFCKLQADVAALIPPLIAATGHQKTRVVEEALKSYAREQKVTAPQTEALCEGAAQGDTGDIQEEVAHEF